MSIFIDKNNRHIDIQGDSDVEAYHNGKCIGSIEFDHNDFGTVLWSMDVDEDYRKAGIATEMMKFAVEMHGKDFGKPSFIAIGGHDAQANEYYTQEGAAFIRKCVRIGLLTDPDEYDRQQYEYDSSCECEPEQGAL